MSTNHVVNGNRKPTYRAVTLLCWLLTCAKGKFHNVNTVSEKRKAYLVCLHVSVAHRLVILALPSLYLWKILF